ncbi:MAG: TolC family protein [Gemmatimonadota bacterium]|jgi:outer membrane protein
MNTRLPRIILGLALLAAPVQAQEPATLTLDEAIALARENNPDYRSRLNDEGVAEWGVRSAYASFLPSASVDGGLSFQSGGTTRIGSFTSGDIGLGDTPDYYYSSYGVSVSLGLSGADFYRVGQEKASRRSVVAGLDVAEQTLEADVTRQYLVVLRQSDAVDLARAQLERAEANLALAEARYAVEAATAIEAKQAEVERGRAEVTLLRSESTLENEKLRLLQLIGVDLDRTIELTSDVPIFEPAWTLESLTAAAMSTQPGLQAATANAQAADAGVGMARSAYWPSLSLSTGLSGFTRRASSDVFLVDQAEAQADAAVQQCEALNMVLTRLTPPMEPTDCMGQFAFTDADRESVLAANDRFPFDFDTEPISVRLGISIPVFQGLNRKQQLETARAQAEDARWELRARELETRASVQAAYRNLNTAYQAVQLEERNREVAADQLRLARERYRVGSAAFLELREAETLMAQADREYLLSVYAFQESLTALEQAVGQKLAIPEN